MNFFCVVLISIWVLFNELHARKTNYDEEKARILLKMSAAAYGEKQEICMKRIFPKNKVPQILRNTNQCDLERNTCSAYIAVSVPTREVTIVFRGTTTTSQLLIEGSKYLEEPVNFFGMGQVNRYYKNALDALWRPISNVLASPIYAGYKVTFTGHSLGGALAALAAARTVISGYRRGEEITVYTFGEPRVGNVMFATNFDRMIKNSYRVVFKKDIVPHLPRCEKISRRCNRYSRNTYYHHGTEIWYPHSMAPGSQYKECVGEPKGEDATCSNTWVTWMDGYAHDYIINHRYYFGIQVPNYGKTGCVTGFWDLVRK